MKLLKNGLMTGLILQLAIGPVFFFIVNLALQKTIFDGLLGALAVAIIDFFYVALAILGIGKILENKKTKKIFGVASSAILIIFGFIIIKDIVNSNMLTRVNINSTSLFSSFISVLLLTISNPITIVLYTGILGAKGMESNCTKKELFVFGVGIGLATLLFMSISVILLSYFKQAIPIKLVQILNAIVGCLLVGYGIMRFIKISKH